ncbi:unnamed protein product [Rotaria sp. Silwood1]|nr:unnamed protein product [Rotaria sp. Silwood1]CAF1665823.1 unnamed protein product [Rotaria sp. Silwood1]
MADTDNRLCDQSYMNGMIRQMLIDSIDQSLIKGFRMILIGTINDIQVAIICHSDFAEEKLLSLVRMICRSSLQSLTIQTEKSLLIGIKRRIDTNIQDARISLKIFLNGKFHSQIVTNKSHSFK